MPEEAAAVAPFAFGAAGFDVLGDRVPEAIKMIQSCVSAARKRGRLASRKAVAARLTGRPPPLAWASASSQASPRAVTAPNRGVVDVV